MSHSFSRRQHNEHPSEQVSTCKKIKYLFSFQNEEHKGKEEGHLEVEEKEHFFLLNLIFH